MMGYVGTALLLFLLLLPIQRASQHSLVVRAADMLGEGLMTTATTIIHGKPSTDLSPTVPGGGEPHASLTVHALNVLTGLPATGLAMRFLQQEEPNASWTELMRSTTNLDGRLDKSTPMPQPLKSGTYKLRFETGEYWQQRGFRSFYPYVEVVFSVTEEERKVHIPLLLSPYSYTTYRGS